MKGGLKMTRRDRSLVAFMREHGGKAYRYACCLSHNDDEAQDLVQDAYCRVLRSWESDDARRPIKPWFFSILRNCFIDSRRSKRRQIAFSSALQHRNGHRAYWNRVGGMDDGAFLEDLIKKDALDNIRAAVARLQPKQRVMVQLRDIEGGTYGELARKLRVPMGTVRSRLHRARRALRDRMEAIEVGA